MQLLNPHGVLRPGFDPSFPLDRAFGAQGGVIHSWGPIEGGAANPLFDVMLVGVHWWQTHVGPGRGDFSVVQREIERICRGGKRAFLYPHPAWPPLWSGVTPFHPDAGWIDYFDPRAHELHLEWSELIAIEFGRDECVAVIRMSVFDHGEAWVHPPLQARFFADAQADGKTPVDYARPFMRRIYEAFLKHSDPERLYAHGGGLQGEVVPWAVSQGTGHGGGSHLLDFGAANHFARPAAAQLENGHLQVRSLAQDGSRALYISEEQTGEAFDLQGEAFRRWLLVTLASAITLRINYLMLPEMLFNTRSYSLLSGVGRNGERRQLGVSPDSYGRLTRRHEEAAPQWEHDEEAVQLAQWGRSLLGTTDENTPEAFVQLSRHYVGAREQWIEAFEHGMRFEWQDAGEAVEEFDLGVGSQVLQSMVGQRMSCFARRTDKASGRDRFRFSLHEEFARSLNGREGELLEARVCFRDNSWDSFGVFYARRLSDGTTQTVMAAPGEVNMHYSGGWRTACFLLSDPDVRDDVPFRVEVRPLGALDLTLCWVRILKLYG